MKKKINEHKQRNLVKALEKKCVELCNSQDCGAYNSKNEMRILCEDCRLNKLFTKIVGLPMEEFV